MSHSQRNSRGRGSISSRGSISGPSGDPFTDASYLESGASTSDNYASSDEDLTPVPSHRTSLIPNVSHLAITYPPALAVNGQSDRPSSTTAQPFSSPPQRHLLRRSTSDQPRLSNLVRNTDGSTSTSPHRENNPNETFRFPITLEERLPPPRHRESVAPSLHQQPASSPDGELHPYRNHRSTSGGRRSSVAPGRQGSESDHPPPPVSLQNPRGRSSAGGRRLLRSVERAQLRNGTILTGDSQNSNDDDILTEASSDLSDTASNASAIVEDGKRSVFDGPFSTPQQQRRRLAKQVSDDIDPLSPPKSKYSPKKYSPVKIQRGHERNFSRPFSSSSKSGSSADEKEDKITELPVVPAANRHVTFDPMFDSTFSFDNTGRRTSHSLKPQAQADAQKEARKDALNGEKRRRSSCVLVNRRKSKYTIEEEKVARAVGRKRLKWTKWTFVAFFLIANGACIAISWMFQKYWWVFAPVILLGNVLNTLMVLNLTRIWLWRKIKKITGFKKPPILPTEPTVIAMVLACYCESHDELMATLESLHDQTGIDHHKRMFVIVVDGQVKGKGMAKSTDRILVEDILKPTEEHFFPVGYESWDGAINGIYASAGDWRGVPYVCLVKKRNLGKRDGLILVRTLLYKYQFRFDNPQTSMGDDFFRWFCEFSEEYEIEKFEWLVGVDADTTFNRQCIYEMYYQVIQDPRLVGCSGLIQVGFRTGNWNFWNLYQNTEYIRAQCLRRMHQALGTGKVSCLPGACQIIKICEETCSDKILIETFGHIPDPKDHMVHQVRALAGEDRNYICIIFKHYPKAITTMAIKAIAFTDPPNGVMVFLSQRKRWTLSTSANDLLISSKNAMNWFERICSISDVIVWVLPIFVAQTLALFIKACIHATDPTFILAFASVTIVPMTYGLIVTYWGCHGWRERVQYLLGFAMVVVLGQLITPCVILYAIWHMDNFSWGKTREVEDDGTGSKPAHSD